MNNDKHWHLICYDIRDQKRWAKVFKILKGYGEHLQYSIFRVRMNKTQLEKLRWQLTEIMDEEDDLMIVRLCPACAKRVIDSRDEEKWKQESPSFEVI
ncbi:CRISPR-associated endonuclease Cas2 [Desulfovulcanus sp.]